MTFNSIRRDELQESSVVDCERKTCAECQTAFVFDAEKLRDPTITALSSIIYTYS